MGFLLRLYFRFSLLLLLATLFLGLLASWAFLYPDVYNHYFPFYQLRPMHVSAALFWILSAATASIFFYKRETFNIKVGKGIGEPAFIIFWMMTIVAVFISYLFKKFGGREYWEFPPILCAPLLLSWLLLMSSYFRSWLKIPRPMPLYIWMWSTGIFFFLFTFLEQNLWQIAWFRSTFLKELTVQWKANGAMVGAWNQMIYGTSLYLMTKISGDISIAQNKKAFFFYLLGLTNLMFNWGHHIYNLPAASWIRNVSYIISMTEWLIFISIIQGFRSKMTERQKFRHIISYRFIIASEFWVFVNLCLALMMSIPAINRYTHGTHITVAHAMGTTIGINTMILLASFSYILRIDDMDRNSKRIINICYWVAQFSLGLFWLALVLAGIMKGYRSVSMHIDNLQEVMQPIIPVLKVFSLAGIGILFSLGTIALIYMRAIPLFYLKTQTAIVKNKVDDKQK